ncbi:MAG: cupin domain-containing protein [Gammaproteobacteria bacterium]
MTDSLVIPDLLSGAWRDQSFQPFHDGVEICPLVQEAGLTTAALLRYAPGASVPRHRHRGGESILVLDGAQSDERGRYTAGDWVLNRTGSEHAVWSDEGCVVLIYWQQPVEFI